MAFAPITYSRNDTKPTRDQVTEHNTTYDAVCPPGTRPAEQK